jgi:hypothetical protein
VGSGKEPVVDAVERKGKVVGRVINTVSTNVFAKYLSWYITDF